MQDLKADPDVREAALASERYALLNAVKAGYGKLGHRGVLEDLPPHCALWE